MARESAACRLVRVCSLADVLPIVNTQVVLKAFQLFVVLLLQS